MSKALNLSPSARLDLIIKEDSSYGMRVKLKNAAGVYQELNETWELIVWSDIRELARFAIGTGLNISVDLLTLTLSVADVMNLINPGEYHYNLRGEIGGYSKTPLYGTFTVEETKI